MARRLIVRHVGRRQTTYTAGRDTAGRWSRLPVTVTVTVEGHWYRSDDPRNQHNDLVCRGCGHTGHFTYILDYQPCTTPAGRHDIACALGVKGGVR